MYPTMELLKEGEKYCLFPPRFKIKCTQINNSSESLYCSLEISKKCKDKEIKAIGEFQLIKAATGIALLILQLSI